MPKLKPVDLALLWELITDSRRSDRQLAKAIGASQPTVTRRRTILERDFLDGYTALPRFGKIGFGLMAFTFVKSKLKFAGFEDKKEARRKGKNWVMEQSNVVFSIAGEGMGWDGMCVSFQKNYSDYVEFVRKLRIAASDFISESQSFIADIGEGFPVKPLHFKYLEKMK